VKLEQEPDNLAGAITLLRDCVGGCKGQRLLIVSEPANTGYYDDQAPKITAMAGRALGMIVFTTETDSFANSEDARQIILDSLRGFDHIVFFSRIGDQIRFSDASSFPPATMCYTLDSASLNSKFGTACHHGMAEIRHVIDRAFETATEIRVTCPRGTHYVGRPDTSGIKTAEESLKRFPLLVPRPIPAKGFCGRIALSRFLIGTGNCFYEPYYLSLPNDVFAIVEHNAIVDFEGPAGDVERVKAHYRCVSEQLGVAPWYLDSWHAGIHPGCNFESNAESDIMRWSGTAFGNPRILHFHTCGEYAPGEISWNILDPTIELDGIRLWDEGTLHIERLPQAADVLVGHPNLATLFKSPERMIGISA